MLAYWVNLQGHCDTHPAKSVLKDCWEHNESHLSFGWVGDAKAATVGLCQRQYSSAVSFSSIPPWLFPLPSVDLNIQLELKNNSKHLPVWRIVKNYFDKHFTNSVFIFTDGSKEPDKGKAGAAVFIPLSETCIKKRVSDHVSVYTTELWCIQIHIGITVDRGEGGTQHSYCF